VLTRQPDDTHQQIVHFVIEQSRYFEELAAALRAQSLAVCATSTLVAVVAKQIYISCTAQLLIGYKQ